MSQLVFTRDRLIAGRPVRDADARSPRQVVLGLLAAEQDGMIGRYDQRYWRVFDQVASGDGRWLSWMRAR